MRKLWAGSARSVAGLFAMRSTGVPAGTFASSQRAAP
mgnify:CR=1 FL=1